MHDRLLSFIVLNVAALLCSAALSAQTTTVTGRVVSQEDSLPLAGVVIEYVPTSGGQTGYATTNKSGNFTLSKINSDTYNLKITCISRTPYTATLKANQSKVELGTIRLAAEDKEIEAVVVEGVAMRTSQKGDTLIYNAGAYKVTQDATTETLLAKMPGMKVEDGKVEVQGEEVKKVTVDGKEFFGDDVTTAIKNLPAEVIDKVQVFDRLSDQGQFSGVDDGQSYKAINLVTHNGVQQAQFGKFTAGYGFNDLYSSSANLNLFKNNRRLTLLGMGNNINQQNFGIDDLLGVMGSGGGRGGRSGRGIGGGGGRNMGNFLVGNQSGVSTIKSFGINYSNQWNSKVRFEGSYFFNTSKNTTESLTDRDYFVDQQNYLAQGRDLSRNFNHRINALIEYKIDTSNTVIFRSSLRFQRNDASSTDTSATSLEGTVNSLLNYYRGANATNSDGHDLSGSLIYMHRFNGRAGRVLSVSFNGNSGKNNQDNTQYTLTRYLNPDSTSTLDQYILNHSKNYTVSGGISYSEPLTNHLQLVTAYNLSYNFADRDKRSYDLPDLNFLDSLSNTYNSGYLTHRVGPGLRFNTDKYMVVADINYQYATLAGDQQFPSSAQGRLSADFNNVVYMAMARLRFNRTNSLHIRLNSNTNNPSIDQLQSVLDVSNPLFVSQGNPNLKPVYGQTMEVRYLRTNVQKGQTLMVRLSGSVRNNTIASSVERASTNGYEVKDDAGNTIITLDRGAQYSRPVNLNGYWSLSSGLSYGLPVSWLKSNVNFDLSTSYTASPTIYNLVRSTTTTSSYTGGITLGSNISQNLDFMFSYRAGYNIAHSTTNTEYFNGVGSGRLTWITWKGITLRADGSYSKYRGVTDHFNEEFFLLNASLGKKLFNRQRGEVYVQVSDILNQNKNFARTVSDNYIQNITSNVLGRYVSINFVYNLRNFKGKDGKSYDRADGKRDQFRPEGQEGSGPPPRGMGGGPGAGGPPAGGGMPF